MGRAEAGRAEEDRAEADGAEVGGILDVASIARDFDRVRRGYDPAAVDHHLALITSRIKLYLERRTNAPDESLDLVLKATRRSVDQVLTEAHQRAEVIVAEAEAAAAAAEDHAAARCRALDAEGRERYAEMGRLTEARAETLAAIEEQIAEQQTVLRSTASGLERLAASLTDTSSPAWARVAAMDDGGVEIVLPAQRGAEG